MTQTRWEEPAPHMQYYEQYFPEIEKPIDEFIHALPGQFREGLGRELKRMGA